MDPTELGLAEKLVAGDVARGVSRLFLRHDLLSISEVPLGNGRRVDLFAISPKGLVTIVEIKVSKADLLGDGKWPEYLDYCDRFFWAVPQGFDLALLERPHLMPERTGLIVADRYDAAILREAPAARPGGCWCRSRLKTKTRSSWDLQSSAWPLRAWSIPVS